MKEQCAAGANIEFETYKDVGHFEVRTTAAADVSGWMLDRIAGKPAATGCTGNPGRARAVITQCEAVALVAAALGTDEAEWLDA